MYFSENLATCTIRWVSFCEGGVVFFIFSVVTGLTCPHPGLRPHSPPGDPSAPGTATRYRQQGRPRKARHTRPDAGHAAPVCTRCQTGHAGTIGQGAGCWMPGNSSIMRIVIALSQAWYIDSNMNKYHKDILLFLVIVNCYLSIDIPFY